MPVYSIGACGCCGEPCPVSWRFTQFFLRFNWIMNGDPPTIPHTFIGRAHGAPIEIEVTYANGDREIVNIDATFNFIGDYEEFVTSTQGTIALGNCVAEWAGSWTNLTGAWAFDATLENGTFTYGQFVQIRD